MVSIEDASSAADIIALAAPHFAHEDVVKQMLPVLQKGPNAAKVVVDASNRCPRKSRQAEKPAHASCSEQLTQILRNQGAFSRQ